MLLRRTKIQAAALRSLCVSVCRPYSNAGQQSFINPLDLTEENVSQVYGVSREEVKAMLPHGLPRRFTMQVEALGRVCWLLRRQSYEIMKDLRNFSSERTEGYRFLLHGPSGSGKTLCMNQVVHWCAKAGWLVLQIPRVFSWVHSRSELRPSPRLPGCYDQPLEASSWLKNFRAANSQLLGQIRLREDHSWTKREKSAAGDDLSKIIDQGLLKPNLATDVVGVVMREVVRSHDRFKLLLAVDQFNGCFGPTSFQLNKNEWVEPERLTLLQYVSEYTAPGKFPGAVLLALSKTGMRRQYISGNTPAQLLGEKGLEVASKCKSVEVHNFRRDEMDNLLKYFTEDKWFKRAKSPGVGDELWYLTTGNPQELSRLCLWL